MVGTTTHHTTGTILIDGVDIMVGVTHITAEVRTIGTTTATTTITIITTIIITTTTVLTDLRTIVRRIADLRITTNLLTQVRVVWVAQVTIVISLVWP